MSFDNNLHLTALFGEQDCNLLKIEEKLGVSITSRGNMIFISGDNEKVTQAEHILESLYHKLEQGMEVGMSEVEAALRMVSNNKGEKKKEKNTLFEQEIVVKTAKKQIVPHSNTQKQYIKALYKKDLVFANGPAGTGKTYLAVAVGVSMFLNHKVERIILVRPAVEAGEKIGFLPGDMKEKVDPYMQPLYDALYDMFPAEKVQKYIESRVIEIAPLAFMRGRTLKDAFVILDEAQNATPTQMKMFLTRLGENSRMVVNGDLSQIDLPPHSKSGLDDALNKLRNIDEIGYVQFGEDDIVRHNLVAKIVHAYKE
ncbi:MAG: PhoH family protein [Rickettsiales bacterium]|nr:PhoH family protein [Rickettsiales bacterium]